jgi:N-acetylmuramoyl-L-alanine amidase
MPTRHDVQQGDCLSSISAQYGISWEKIWNYGENADLKQLRKDPSVLFPGDVVVVPDKDPKAQACATDLHHKFKTNRKRTHIKIRMLLDDQPRSDLKYELLVSGRSIKGVTDGGGYLSADIPPDVQSGVLLVGDGDPRETYHLGFGTLDPIVTDDGVKKRLVALGLSADKDLAEAIRAFQAKSNMTVTGTADDALHQKLTEQFGQ